MAARVRIPGIVLALTGLAAGATILLSRCRSPRPNPTPASTKFLSQAPEESKSVLWELSGYCYRMVNGREVPVAGARIRVTNDEQRLEAEEGTTDAGGHFRMDVEILKRVFPEDRASGPQAWAEDKGLATRKGTLIQGLPDRNNRPYSGKVRLRLHPHATLRGRVVDASGHLVPRAFVEFVDPARHEKKEYHSHHQYLEDGTFRFRCFHIALLKVRAHDDSVGVSPWVSVDITGFRETRIPDLVLQPQEVIEGIARFPDGRPVPHLHLEVRRNFGQYGHSVCLENETYEGYGRFSSADLHTDARGRFRAACLRPGEYEIRLFQDFSRDPLARNARTGQRDVELLVDISVLVLLAWDEGGNPVKKARYRIRTWYPPLAAIAAARYAARGDLTDLVHEYARGYIDDADGKVDFVHPETFHVIALVEAGYEVREHAVHFGPGEFLKTVILVKKPIREKAHITFSLRDETGEEVPDCTVRLTPMIPQGRFAYTTRAHVVPGTPIPDLSPGRYHLRLEGVVWKHCGFEPSLSWKSVEDTVTLAPGHNHFSYRTWLWSHLTVWAGLPLDMNQELEDLSSVTLIGNSIRKRLGFVHFMSGIFMGPVPWCTPCTELPPGRYRVRVNVPGHYRVEKTVDLKKGRYTTLEIEYDDRD